MGTLLQGQFNQGSWAIGGANPALPSQRLGMAGKTARSSSMPAPATPHTGEALEEVRAGGPLGEP